MLKSHKKTNTLIPLTEVPGVITFIDREQDARGQGLGQQGEELLFNGYRRSVWADKKVVGMGAK